MSSAGSARPASRSQSRYGSSPKSTGSWTNRAIVLVFLAAFIAMVVFGVQYFRTQQKVNANISYVSHEILSDDTARIWVDITRNRVEEPAYCIVQAFDYSKAEVGRREIAVPAGGEEAQRVAIDVPTNHRAVAGGAYGCSVNIPSYLDISTMDSVEFTGEATDS
ncbi:DUF4307 domain-containing protein [Corynebacterium minutissimum]|uniref:DUF4307 domain-containing protein n=1 Tax=Corynebacterium minutissimum TaxID=38301 RepID=A0A2X4UQG4_9CORY|nr:DUF4307 domain-containing protein [Corynebacterium minutissimum]KHO29805.1 hypothetical protein NX84_05560 [Corynebacterium minutissimum]QPS58583.1 DUF4307 domain-containing protein [Corynebacterium minutissimum]QQA78425.1 DUF4307 domain-containing protein [Corynebacterium minutissimum]SQI00314.1 putative secreted protein [Corynebacterium minutissimum]VEG05619.1 putative secreted protein [Corynebacterium minutissimum]